MKIERTFLFVPADRPERFGKAAGSGADVVILDLEDAVPPEHKDSAREQAASFLAEGKGARLIMRINGSDTPWHQDDLAAVRAAGAGEIMLPKTSSARQIETVLDTISESVEILPLVETAEGVVNLADIASHPRIRRLAFGSIDLQMDIAIPGDREALLFARAQMVLHSKARGLLPPIDGVTTDMGDDEAVLADCRYARKLGFGGKLCIHPRQISPALQGFEPGQEEVEWAREVTAAVSAGQGAVSVRGKMVDAPVVEYARRILASCS
ncbi:citrate lyase [Sinorhizobium meliloti CCNWSX0020]|uniref:Citrate lyase n=1 Tax=Sinorhizobium meliloti CCNWSX0020 TaxID=1107881 RepID=H0G2F8_RHIML|nr:CoA ester lyase [Sinorhizobium meliloti]EHK76515.1 citrate lyase [Sinorhizobium meliloti CCNWSX0020]